MDTDIIGFLAAIIITAVISWFERKSNKKNHQTVSTSHKPANAALPRKPARKALAKTTAAPKKQKNTPFLDSSNEGFSAIETSAPVAKEKPIGTIESMEEAELSELHNKEMLKKAIIWGEVLQRKF